MESERMDGREPRCSHRITAARMKKLQAIRFEWTVWWRSSPRFTKLQKSTITIMFTKTTQDGREGRTNKLELHKARARDG